MANLIGSTADAGTAGVVGENINDTPAAGVGVYGKSNAAGVVGESQAWHGVVGHSWSTIGGQGVYGKGFSNNCGVFGESTTGAGVQGKSEGAGVIGTSTKWVGVYGETAGIENGPAGVWGEHKGAGTGVKAVSKDGVGLAAYSTSNEAIHAETKSPGTAAIAAYNLNPAGTGAAIFAKKEGSQGHAGFFAGNVVITGILERVAIVCPGHFGHNQAYETILPRSS
jgi:hypothetical protein